MSNPLADMEKPDVIFCIGTNMTEATRSRRPASRRRCARGAKMIVADPRRIALAELRRPVPADPRGLRRGAAARHGARHRARGPGRRGVHRGTAPPKARRSCEHVQEFTPEWAADDLRGAGRGHRARRRRCTRRAERGAIYYTLGITEHICGVDNVQSLCNLALMTGNIGREGTGINPMRGQNNIQGAGDCGRHPEQLPRLPAGHRPREPGQVREGLGREGRSREAASPRSRRSSRRARRSARCSSTARTPSSPTRTGTTASTRSESLDHLVVIDIFLTETAALADVVLPATALGRDRRRLHQHRAPRAAAARRRAAPGRGASPDWWIVSADRTAHGLPGLRVRVGATDVFNELCELSAIYHGLDWDRIDEGRIPVAGARRRAPRHAAPARGGVRERARASSRRTTYRDPAEVIDDEYPVWLTTGRRLAVLPHAHPDRPQPRASSTCSPRSRSRSIPTTSPTRASRTAAGRVTSRRGSVEVQVQANPRSPRGTVFVSFSFADMPVNVLTGGGYDPVTQTPEVKVCPVRVEPVPSNGSGERGARPTAAAPQPISG